MIEARGIRARIGASEVLKGVDLTIRSGQLVTVIGANGAGKTSLLRVLSNVLPATAGTIQFDGMPTAEQTPYRLARSGLVHVPQGRQIVPSLSVRDNLLLGTHPLGMAPDELARRLAAELQRFPVLRERQHLPGGALSGGEQQMLAVSRGLMMRPKLLMLDEPSLGLAPKIVRLILGTLRKLADEGLAVLLVEQVAMQAVEHADRAVVLRNGECVIDADAASLRGSQALVDSYLS
jgi:branched-chain amino acid transport system ATP-binding protein